MAPPAKSRKGKKAWRKNIDASEVETFIEEQTYQQRRGPAAKELKDDQLFFVDTTADAEGAAAVTDGKRPAKRRREEAAARPLRSQEIIAEAHKAKPLILPPPIRKPKPAAAAAKGSAVAAVNGKRRSSVKDDHPLDIWGDEDFGLAAPGPGSTALVRHEQQQEGRKVKKAKKAVMDKSAAALAAVRVMGPSAKPLRRSPPPPRVRAVAVDVPGCSFNPDAEQHQDALALLVASELRKELRKELLPTAPPDQVDATEGRPLSELEALQVEAAGSDDDGEEGRQDPGARAAAADPNAIALTEGDGDDEEDEEGGGKRRKKTEKKSRQDRNKEARRKAEELEAAERKRLKAQRRELHTLREVKEQLLEEEREKEDRRLRMASLREERAAVEPPRLGRLRFEAPALQVLTTDEKTGCLRQVVPCSMLAADRFKSLQQRGLVEPRKPQPFKERRRKVSYEKGARSEREAEASAAVRDLTHTNKKARRKAKTEAAARGTDDWM